jgi:hypothetical protein
MQPKYWPVFPTAPRLHSRRFEPLFPLARPLFWPAEAPFLAKPPSSRQKCSPFQRERYIIAPTPEKLPTQNHPILHPPSSLHDLTGTESAKAIAAGSAQEDTAARDAAYNALKEYMKEIMGTARGAFRGNAGALTKLKL